MDAENFQGEGHGELRTGSSFCTQSSESSILNLAETCFYFPWIMQGPPCPALGDLISLLPFLVMNSFSLFPSPNLLLFSSSQLPFSCLHLLLLFSIPVPSLLPSYRETKNKPNILMHIDNCLKGVLFFFFWSLELSLLINSL